MAYRQAFHTSCRKGLSGHAGFQYNAASSGLSEEQLTRLAAGHAGYRTPPDAPAEPDAGQIAQLPVTLRYLPVDGVGPVISRTEYVGREFRGAGDEPDSGRFGNYFSHIVVGNGGSDGAEAFGGLLPIELWGAPHWTAEEAEETELPPLDAIEPGPVDLDRVLAELRPRGSAALAGAADAALHAILAGPRLVIVEAEPDLAALWVAWACLSLPPDRAGSLTFSTFDGRPRMAEAVQVCVTTPECDVDFPPYELGSSVVLLSPRSLPAADDLSLYGRVLGALVEAGGEAVSAATRELGSGLELEAAGAELAVAAGHTELATAAEVADVLAVLRSRLGRVPAEALADMAAALPASNGLAQAFGGWWRLYAAARQSEDPGATTLVDVALGRLLDSLDDADEELPVVGSDSPAVPSASVLVRWLGMVTEAVDSKRLGPVLAVGARLGLVGCNTALDKELAAPIAAGFADPAVEAAYESLAGAGSALVVEGVAVELAGAAGAGHGLDLLKRVAVAPIARKAVRANAEEVGDFESVAAWELLCTDSDPGRRASAVAALAARAENDGHAQAIRGLFGDRGPVRAEEHAELLAGWAEGGRDAPALDFERALGCLAELSLRDAKQARRLVEALREGPLPVRGDPDLIVWSLALEPAPEKQDFRLWAETAAQLRDVGVELSPSRRQDLDAMAARVAVRSLREPDFKPGVEALLTAMGEQWPLDLGDALAGFIEKSVNPGRLVAGAFVAWYPIKNWRDVLIEVSLPRATRDRSLKELEAVGEILNEKGLERWESWLEEHPPRRGMSRAVRGVFRRGEDR